MRIRAPILSVFFGLLIFVPALFGLNACYKGSDGSSSQFGSVALLLTDGPSLDFDEVNVTINEIKLLGNDHQVTVFQGSEMVNLLDLSSHANLFAFVEQVPAGSYDKIRLIVDNITLLRYQGQGSDAIFTGEQDDEIFHPKISGNGKIDLNPRGSFTVTADETLYIQIDMDANKSIKIDETGNGFYLFRPVVFVDVLNQTLPGKLVRLNGIVKDKGTDDGGFYLCNTNVNYSHRDDDDEPCIKVTTNQDTAWFSADGMSASFSDLANDEPATLLGHFSSSDDDNHDDDLILNAEVVELAAGAVYQRFTGSVGSAPFHQNHFELWLDPGQNIITKKAIVIELIDHAKIYSINGYALSVNDIIAGRAATVEGIVILSDNDPDKIRAAVVFLDETAGSVIKFSGTVTATHIDQNYFEITDSMLGDRCVTVDSNTGLLGLTIDSGINSAPIGLSDLANDAQVDVYGDSWSNGCLVADHVLVSMP